MMTGDALNIMHAKFHEACVLWDLTHRCQTEDLEVDPIKRNIAKNIMMEQLKNTSFMVQLPESVVVSELDLDQINVMCVKEERETTVKEDKALGLAANNKLVSKKDYYPDFELPVTTKIGGQNFVLDSCRIFSKVCVDLYLSENSY